MKYKLTENKKEIFGITLYQIQALKDFGTVQEGDLGGWIEKEDNLLQEYNCWVFGNAIVYGNAKVSGDTKVSGNAIVSQSQRITNGSCVVNISSNLSESIRCQTGIIPINNKIILYKQVRKDLTSFHDNNFKYEIGKVVEAHNCDTSNKSCSSGLHASHANYWNVAEDVMKSTFISIEVDLKDVITAQDGKVRFKKGLVLGRYDIEKEEVR